MLIIIPAKNYSRRLKRKNFLKVGGISLFKRTILFAKKIYPKAEILVSTNSRLIAEIAIKNNCIGSFLRPKSLCKDNATMYSVVSHAVKYYEKKYNTTVSSILLLQPTTPFRNLVLVRKAILQFLKTRNTIISVNKIHVLSNKIFEEKKNFLKFFKKTKPKEIYVPNGSFYLITKKNLQKYKSFYHNNMNFFEVTKKKEMIDIDTKEDLNLARQYLK